jgi:hypothetical protein
MQEYVRLEAIAYARDLLRRSVGAKGPFLNMLADN